MKCSSCGCEIQDNMKFCGQCGSRLNSNNSAYIEDNSKNTTGIRGSEKTEKHTRVKYFYGKASNAGDTAYVVERFLKGENLITQNIPSGNGFIIQGKQKANLLKSALGMDMAVTITLMPDGYDLKVTIGAGKWMDKMVGAGIGLFIFYPTLLTTGWGIYMQQKLFGRIEDDLQRYMQSV